MSTPLSPKREAIQLVTLWRAVKGDVFPVNAGALALNWSQQTAPSDPIGDLEAQELNGFEGGLFWLPTRKVWALLYQRHDNLPGRTNYTIAHEFGHYVLHRKQQQAFQCSQDSTLGVGAKALEREADTFASYLLMPIDDFRAQVASQRVTLDVLSACASRYGVSMTAAILKWVEFTDEPVAVVKSSEGMVDWWRASSSAKNHCYSSLRRGMELPASSLAAKPAIAISPADYRVGIDHPPGIWFSHVPTREMVISSDRYDMTISVLVLDGRFGAQSLDEEPDQDMTTNPPTF